MMTRIFSAITGGVTVTASLFFVMQNLIANGEEVVGSSTPGIVIDWIRIENETDIQVETPAPTRIDKPKIPPTTQSIESTETDGPVINVSLTPPTPSEKRPVFTGLGLGDGPLINIIKVSPQYPTIAASKGLEGTVTVQFDVTAQGIVVNAVIIESTSRVFNKAAIAAAYRFKYKPRVVDGVSYGATGLRNRFRFEMEK